LPEPLRTSLISRSAASAPCRIALRRATLTQTWERAMALTTEVADHFNMNLS